VLFGRSIYRNILFGLPDDPGEGGPLSDALKEKVHTAARLANAHEFIMRDLSQGYDTQVGPIWYTRMAPQS
jgi:ABC-type multidrug transport system fused ATPase/permease subunit